MTVNRSSVPFGIDPPTDLIGSISNAMSPRENCALATCAISSFARVTSCCS
ncbi:hypothetical protein ACFW24_33735 [Streptomyces nigra]|uniref:hypothetical protein n=1 Tax=Streptomyces nigra TaxID=1827580 RepID=UPI0036907AA8